MRANEGWMSELEDNLELEFEDVEDTHASEVDEEVDDDSELADDTSSEIDEDEELESAEPGDYGERFYELSLREFESDLERQRAVHGILDDMEREYFLGGLLKKAGGAIGRAVKKVAKPALKAATQLAGGNMKGLLGTLATSALSSFVPGGALIAPALKGLGFGGGPLGSAGTSSGAPAAPGVSTPAAWSNFADLARDAFERLAASMMANLQGGGATSSEIADPVQASQLAHDAFRTVVRSHASRRAQSRPDGVQRIRVPRGSKRIKIEIEWV